MRSFSQLSLCAATVLATAVVEAQVSTPQAVRIQGFLNQGGAPASGTVTMDFRLWDSQFPGGTIVAAPGPQSVVVSGGVYDVELPLLASDFSDPERYLEVIVNGEVLTPRMRMTSTPFAYDADRLDGFEGADFVRKTGDVMAGPLEVAGTIYSTSGGFRFPDGTVQTTAAISGSGGNTLDQAYNQGGPGLGRTITADSGAVNIAGSSGLTVNGSVGVGTTTPSSKLTVAGTIESTAGGVKFPDGTTQTTFARSVTLDQAYDQGGAGAGRTITADTGAVNIAGSSGLTVNGSVGIGTTSPSSKLTVTGTIESTTGGLKFPDGTTQTTFARSVTLDQAYDQGGAGAGRTITADSGAVNIAGSSGLTVNGSVGIGTTSPSSKLTVAGVIQSTSGGIKFPDGTTQTTAAGARTFAACVNFSGTNCTTIFCGCGAATLVTQVQSDCTVTSETGSCSALSFSCTGGGIGHGTCCVCRPN
jgi:hypothetical protein